MPLCIVLYTYRASNWVPEPTKAANNDLFTGNLKTSPQMHFHPASSWPSVTILLYLLHKNAESAGQS